MAIRHLSFVSPQPLRRAVESVFSEIFFVENGMDRITPNRSNQSGDPMFHSLLTPLMHKYSSSGHSGDHAAAMFSRERVGFPDTLRTSRPGQILHYKH